MKHTKILFVGLIVFVTAAVTLTIAQQSGKLQPGLPKAHYHQADSDPDWLKAAVQIHGHLGPAVVFGTRLGMIGRDAVNAEGYFDVEVTAQGPFAKPPQSCILDGLQISTGATLGKRNLKVIEADEYVFVVKNIKTGVIAEIRPTTELLKLMWSRLSADNMEKEDEHTEVHRVEAIARQVAGMSQEKLMTIKVMQ